MRKYQFFLSTVLIVSSLVFAGCSLPGATPKPAATPASNAARVGDTTTTGVVMFAGNKYYLQTNDKRLTLNSYSIDLSTWKNQNVTVTGQFSGDELFITKINSAK